MAASNLHAAARRSLAPLASLTAELRQACSANAQAALARRFGHFYLFLSHAMARQTFSIGQIVATPGVLKILSQQQIATALQRHARGDWGDVGPDDGHENDRALKEEGRLLSAYHADDGTKFWIITEWDRSATTILLPDEY